MNSFKLLSICILTFVSFFVFGNCIKSENENSDTDVSLESAEQLYNKQLADELGADDYGMKQYIMAFLKAGPNRDMDSTRAAELQRAHLDNIRRMAENGDLILAGPFMDRGKFRGIYIFDVQTIEEAKKLTETDPAIQAGRLEMELHPWYGSAALMKVNEIHKTISRETP